ncbi:class F sortase [Streptomyces sp. NPDC048504]|uniref:class F sortase n=1 Tax=Streptomyces sp. NPDC048504 TaxID=3365559 RepID=UPI00371582A2
MRPRHGPRPAGDGRRPGDRTFRGASGRTALGVVRYGRPWYRTRAFRLARTLVLAVVMMVGGARCAGGADASGPSRATPPATDLRTDARGGRPAPPARPTARPSRPSHPVARPVRTASPPRPLPHSRAITLAIPYLDVDAPVMPLRLDRGHRMSAPPDDDPKRVGWYADGPSPGEQGTAVAVGHLDTMTGPAVFAGLGELKPDHRIEVRRADGRTAVYTVDAVRTYEKAHFPDREVYGARGRPELRLITCGGSYDRRTGYAGNTVVFAHLLATRERARTG